jgi:hypothetical protein
VHLAYPNLTTRLDKLLVESIIHGDVLDQRHDATRGVNMARDSRRFCAGLHNRVEAAERSCPQAVALVMFSVSGPHGHRLWAWMGAQHLETAFKQLPSWEQCWQPDFEGVTPDPLLLLLQGVWRCWFDRWAHLTMRAI